MKTRANVPCNGCRACCINDMIVLHPEMGDDASTYLTEPTTNPITGKPVLQLRHKPNGECIYLGDTGCTIHDRAPAICREYDCRRNFLQFSRNERRHFVKIGLMSKEKFAEGRRRLHTLSKPVAR